MIYYISLLMEQGLFESLTGHFTDGTPVEALDPRARTVRSIMDNLDRLLNTREGMIPHLRGYGLPDISEIYRQMPRGEAVLADSVKRCVERYEPRLTAVHVNRAPDDGDRLTLRFIVSGTLAGGTTVSFQTLFRSSGRSSIVPFKSTSGRAV